MDENKEPILGPKPKEKSPKKEGYLEFQVKVGASRADLLEWADLAAEAGFRPKAQKVFKQKPNGFAGEEIGPDTKGLSKWFREAVVAEYKAHAWEREQKRADALKRKQEAEDDLKKMGGI